MGRTSCSLIVLAGLLLGLGGCANDIGGEWQSREKLSNGQRNELFLDGEGGELVLYVLAGDAHQRIEFDVGWASLGGDLWEVDLDCDAGCLPGMDLNLDLACEHFGDLGHLDCEAEAPLSSYGYLEFERPGE